MQKRNTDKLEDCSNDLVAENIEKLKALFPELITEGPHGMTVNADRLSALVGGKIATDAEEMYGLNWHGKRRAQQLALTPSSGTLRPCPEESVDWDTTGHSIIEGDNLEVLKLLQKSYASKIKLIYIDPPYNTGKDFVYSDNFLDNIRNYLELTGKIEGGKQVRSNTDASGRFHTNWLNMIYPRLKLARNLLSSDGLIVVHIDEHEVHSLVTILREIFGEENELGVVVWDKRNPKGDARGIAYQHESIVFFARNADVFFEKSPLLRPKKNARRMLDQARNCIKEASSLSAARIAYRKWVKEQATLSGGEAMYDRLTDDGRIYRLVSMAWPNKKKAPDDYFRPLVHPVTGKECPVPERGWRNPPDTMKELQKKGLIEFGADERTQPQRIYYLDENMYESIPSILQFGGSDDTRLKELGIPFDHPKPVEFASSIISWCTGSADIVLDFFAGSGTTAHAVLEANLRDGGKRRHISVQLPEPLEADSKEHKAAASFCAALGLPKNLAEISKERLRRVSETIRLNNPEPDRDTGFRVLKLDTGNTQKWNPDAADLEKSLLEAVHHLKPDRSDLDLIFELMLQLGLDLNSRVLIREAAGKLLYAVGKGEIIACLADDIGHDDVEPLAEGVLSLRQELDHDDAATFIIKDSSFSDDVAKINLASLLEQAGLSRIRSL